MSKWEDIVKDKMEAPEGALPESVFAEFHARREAAAAAPAPKRIPLVWAVVPAVAAGLAAVLLLHRQTVPEGDLRIMQQPPVPVAVVPDSTTASEPVQTTPPIARAAMPAVRPSVIGQQAEVTDVDSGPAAEIVTADVEEDTVTAVTISSPVMPERAPAKPVKMEIGSAAGIVAGGALVAALAAPFLGAARYMDAAPVRWSDKLVSTDPELPTEEPSGVFSHHFPLRLGLSTKIPLAKRLNLSTGLEYALYSSRVTYPGCGEKTQLAHYLGVPVRLDWTLASNSWLDVYVGGGLAGDYCIGATLAGEKISKDGFGLSLLGAAGLQLNLTKRTGLYMEPEISWTIPSESRVLQTYRTENPLMFSLVSGIRIDFGK